ncbi:hypothetical protein BS17DRAFT_784514 [Gyrodon lividus]|nr:hypothetical protein BS17DRAFT_784514 [Gyrodon lividus]
MFSRAVYPCTSLGAVAAFLAAAGFECRERWSRAIHDRRIEDPSRSRRCQERRTKDMHDGKFVL